MALRWGAMPQGFSDTPLKGKALSPQEIGTPTHDKRGNGRRWRRGHRQELSRGFLDTEQRLEWSGKTPSRARLEALPARFEREHFREVERSAAGLLRCRREGDRVVCRLLGRWPALIFADERATVAAESATRCWRILGGLLARPDPEGYGTLTLGLAVVPDPTGDTLLALWSRVESYPSRLLAVRPPAGTRLLWRVVGRIYAAYHARVTFRCLDKLAAFVGMEEQ